MQSINKIIGIKATFKLKRFYLDIAIVIIVLSSSSPRSIVQITRITSSVIGFISETWTWIIMAWVINGRFPWRGRLRYDHTFHCKLVLQSTLSELVHPFENDEVEYERTYHLLQSWNSDTNLMHDWNEMMRNSFSGQCLKDEEYGWVFAGMCITECIIFLYKNENLLEWEKLKLNGVLWTKIKLW